MVEAVVRQVGDMMITRIPELQLTSFTPQKLFPDLAAEAGNPSLFPASLMTEDGNVVLSSHSWLVRGRGRTILIDTGVGAGKSRPLAPYFDNLHPRFLEALARYGVAPEDVDYVLLTHLHVDHIGWNTVSSENGYRPTFPNAKYLFSGAEYRFFCDPENHIERHRTSFMARADSVDPIVEAGQAVMVDVDGQEVLPGIRYFPTPGHSPFHASISISVGDTTALFVGDTLHHHAQIIRPDINSVFDADPELARKSRQVILEQASASNTLIFGAHLAGTSIVKVEKSEKGYHWIEA